MAIIAFETDLHFEFHKDGGQAYIATMDPTDVDVLILGGDIAYAKDLGDVLKRLRDKYPAVITVLGNHELYTDTVQNALETIDRIQIPGVHVLRRQIVEIAGLKIAGTTLWFREPIDYKTILAKRDMNDFHVIKGFEPWVYNENTKDREFFDGLKPGDAHVIVTHHLPHHRCVSQQYRGDPLNPFFLCDMTPAIERAEPLVWLHGHTHGWIDHQVNKTRIIANPLGYPNAINPRHHENFKLLIIQEIGLVANYP